MPASWIVNVAGRAYGPYTDAQMQAFASEGRLAPQSLVARNGEAQFRAAADEPALAALFGLHKMADGPKPVPAATVTPIKPAEGPSAFGQKEDPEKPGERAHIIIIADMKSRSI